MARAPSLRLGKLGNSPSHVRPPETPQHRARLWRDLRQFIVKAPHTENYGHNEDVHEPVTRMDGVELPWHVLVNDGAQKKRGIEPDPHPDSKKHGALPVDDPKKHDEAREHVEVLGVVVERARVKAQFHPRIAEQERAVPHRAYNKRRESRNDEGPIVYFARHVLSFALG